MKVTLEDTHLHTVYISDDGDSGQQLAYILKRLLLSHSNIEGAAIQTAAVQSLVLLLRGPVASSFAVAVLNADIAGAVIVVITRFLLLFVKIYSTVDEMSSDRSLFTFPVLHT